MAEISLPLEELQDIGERYSPHVLRAFFLSNGIASETNTGNNEIHFGRVFSFPLSSEKLNRVKRIMILTVPAYLVCTIAGALAFASQANTWDDITDMALQETVVEAALPSILGSVLGGYAVISSTIFELICAFLISGFRYRSIFHLIAWISGIASIALFVTNCYSLVVIAKAAPKLALIGLAPYLAGLGLISFALPVRTIIALSLSDNYELTSNCFYSFFRRRTGRSVSTSLTAASRDGQETQLPPELDHAVNCPPNHALLRRVAHACVALDWNLLFAIFTKRYLPFSIQTDLILAASVKGYVSMLSYQLLLLPVYVFFLYDVGNNLLVYASLVLSLVAAASGFIINVVPIYRSSIHEYH